MDAEAGGESRKLIMDISGRRVLITGANRGLGRALVFAFAKAGVAEVLAGARNAEDIEQLKSDAQTGSFAITPLKLDVTSDDDIGAAANLGFVDILVDRKSTRLNSSHQIISYAVFCLKKKKKKKDN